MIIPKNFNTRGQRTESYIKKNYPEFYQYLIDNYKEFPFSEALYRYVFNINNTPICKTCGSPVKFISFSHGYPKYCCSLCSNKDPEKIKKQIETSKEKYGERYESVVKKHHETSKEKYGDNYRQLFLEKRKKTCLEKYGGETPLSSKDVRQKINETISKRSAEEKQKIVQKVRQTKLERYGDENYNNIELLKSNNLKKYGVEFPFQSQEIQEKGRRTRLEKYGSIYPLQNAELNNKSKKTREQNYINNSDIIIDRIKKDGCEFFRCKCPHLECDKCSEKYFDIPYDKFFVRQYDGCELCTILCKGDTNKGTTIELFIRNILDKNGIEYETNNKKILKGKELDIYIPSHKIAIECNGIYWHSLKENSYHYDKWNECKNEGIQLLTFWEDQIINSPEIVRSIILSKLGIYSKKIYARNCEIKQVPNQESVKFLIENHLQGNTAASVRYGLYYNDELVSLMTFGKKRRALGNKGDQNNNDWELYRFCNKLNTIVVGGASRLFKKFINDYKPSSIESFSSNDISWGQLYLNLDFIQTKITKGSYWYITKKMKRYHRFQFRKSELVKNGEDPNKTEFEIMKQNGYFKIYDCGQTKYIKTLNN